MGAVEVEREDSRDLVASRFSPSCQPLVLLTMAEKDTYSVRFKPASLRCSACAIAGVTLSFCSVEHQKLVRPPPLLIPVAARSAFPTQVWKTHKLVCGPPLATKFTHSPLTAQEIDFAKRNLDTPNPFAALAAAAGIRSGGVTTLWEGLKIGGLRRDQVEVRSSSCLFSLPLPFTALPFSDAHPY